MERNFYESSTLGRREGVSGWSGPRKDVTVATDKGFREFTHVNNKEEGRPRLTRLWEIRRFEWAASWDNVVPSWGSSQTGRYIYNMCVCSSAGLAEAAEERDEQYSTRPSTWFIYCVSYNTSDWIELRRGSTTSMNYANSVSTGTVAILLKKL